jgi:hypothetical protein
MLYLSIYVVAFTKHLSVLFTTDKWKSCTQTSPDGSSISFVGSLNPSIDIFTVTFCPHQFMSSSNATALRDLRVEFALKCTYIYDNGTEETIWDNNSLQNYYCIISPLNQHATADSSSFSKSTPKLPCPASTKSPIHWTETVLQEYRARQKDASQMALKTAQRAAKDAATILEISKSLVQARPSPSFTSLHPTSSPPFSKSNQLFVTSKNDPKTTTSIPVIPSSVAAQTSSIRPASAHYTSFQTLTSSPFSISPSATSSPPFYAPIATTNASSLGMGMSPESWKWFNLSQKQTPTRKSSMTFNANSENTLTSAVSTLSRNTVTTGGENEFSSRSVWMGMETPFSVSPASAGDGLGTGFTYCKV